MGLTQSDSEAMVITFRCDFAACSFLALKLLSLSLMSGHLTFLEKRKETNFLEKNEKYV